MTTAEATAAVRKAFMDVNKRMVTYPHQRKAIAAALEFHGLKAVLDAPDDKLDAVVADVCAAIKGAKR